MNWAAQYSKTNGVHHIDQQALASIMGFIFWREKTFSRLRAKNIDIPVRAKKRHSLLETLVDNAPEEFRSEIAALLRARERCIPYVVPILRQVAIAFLVIAASERLIPKISMERRFTRIQPDQQLADSTVTYPHYAAAGINC